MTAYQVVFSFYGFLAVQLLIVAVQDVRRR